LPLAQSAPCCSFHLRPWTARLLRRGNRASIAARRVFASVQVVGRQEEQIAGLAPFAQLALGLLPTPGPRSKSNRIGVVTSLARRGLMGHNLRLLATDSCPGLRRAPGGRLSLRCPPALPGSQAAQCGGQATPQGPRDVPHGDKAHLPRPDAARSSGCLLGWAYQWHQATPKVVACLEQDMPKLLAFLDCFWKHQVKVHTTNAMERALREVRRRTGP